MNAWAAQALCRGADISWAFPCDRNPPGTPAYLEELAEIRQTCAVCPVRLECFRTGLQESYGVWGGLDTAERLAVMQLDCLCGSPIDPLRLREGCRKCAACSLTSG